MISRLRQSGQLSLPISSLQSWAQFNGVSFNSIKCDSIPGAGSGVVAERDLKGASDDDGSGEAPLMTIPKELVLSLERVKMFALADRDLSEILEVMGDFARTTRGAIMIFLLTQATITHPSLKESRIGTHTPFISYIKFLPSELLPTLWSSSERYLLNATTTLPATEAKIRSLRREFEEFHERTRVVGWCKDIWWNSTSDIALEFEDWMEVDAMYRSRALEYPGIGDAMVPCIDMANHASNSNTTALYESDADGNAVLLLREGVSVQKGGEVTITYGDCKGACEILFSYGFVDADMVREGCARELFLELDMMSDDPLALAKKRVSTAAPGVKLTSTRYEEGGEKMEWFSEFVWLVIVNEEDGLGFEVLQTTDGGRELQVSWKGEPLSDISTLPLLLQKEELWPVYQLRAATIIQQRVEEQLNGMEAFGEELLNIQFGDGTDIRGGPREMALQLHMLERELCGKASQTLASEIETLAGMEVVKRYIDEMNADGWRDEDEDEDEEVDLT